MVEIKYCKDCIHFIPEEGERVKEGRDAILDDLNYFKAIGKTEAIIRKAYDVLIFRYNQNGIFTGKIWCRGIGTTKDSASICDNPSMYLSWK